MGRPTQHLLAVHNGFRDFLVENLSPRGRRASGPHDRAALEEAYGGPLPDEFVAWANTAADEFCREYAVRNTAVSVSDLKAYLSSVLSKVSQLEKDFEMRMMINALDLLDQQRRRETSAAYRLACGRDLSEVVDEANRNLVAVRKALEPLAAEIEIDGRALSGGFSAENAEASAYETVVRSTIQQMKRMGLKTAGGPSSLPSPAERVLHSFLPRSVGCDAMQTAFAYRDIKKKMARQNSSD